MIIEGVKVKWQASRFKGVRYIEHPTRKHGRVKKDRYFSIRYQVDGKRVEQGLGWSSDKEGWTEEKAALELNKFKSAAKNLKGPKTRSEERKEKLKELEAQRLLDEQKEKDRITFKQASEKYLDWCKTGSEKEWSHDETRLRLHIWPVFGQKQLKKISPADLEQLKMSCMEKGLAPATIRHVLQIVRAVYYFCDRMGVYSGPIPTKNVTFPKVNNKKTRFFSYEQAEKLLMELQSRGHQDVHDITLMAIETGMRFSEIAKLRWENVNLENKIVYILDPKGKEDGEVYVNDRLGAMLEEKPKHERKGIVFPSRSQTVRKDVPDTFMKAVNDLGFNDGVTDNRNKLTFHSTRHTFGSWLALQGTPLLTIKELMRHKTVEMTMRYAHLIPDHKREAVEKLGKRAGAKVIDIREAKQMISA